MAVKTAKRDEHHVFLPFCRDDLIEMHWLNFYMASSLWKVQVLCYIFALMKYFSPFPSTLKSSILIYF